VTVYLADEVCNIRFPSLRNLNSTFNLDVQVQHLISPFGFLDMSSDCQSLQPSKRFRQAIYVMSIQVRCIRSAVTADRCTRTLEDILDPSYIFRMQHTRSLRGQEWGIPSWLSVFHIIITHHIPSPWVSLARNCTTIHRPPDLPSPCFALIDWQPS
jgi:hypothetical protein